MALTYIGANQMLGKLIGPAQYGGGDKTLGLSTTLPDRDGKGYTEPPESAGYGRVPIGKDPDGWGYLKVSNLGSVTNTTTIFFPEATAAWGTCKYFLLFDGGSPYNLLAYGTLDAPISPQANEVAMIRPGGIVMTLR